jgi:hypothetical protein
VKTGASDLSALSRREPSCPHCGGAIFYARECDGRPHKLDRDPVPEGQWTVVAWDAILPEFGISTTFVEPFDPAHENENRYAHHTCKRGDSNNDQ